MRQQKNKTSLSWEEHLARKYGEKGTPQRENYERDAKAFREIAASKQKRGAAMAGHKSIGGRSISESPIEPAPKAASHAGSKRG